MTANQTKWSDQAWKTIEPVFSKIVNMPFIQEMIDGSLDMENFRFYIAQDDIYLEHFGKALALIATRTNDSSLSLAYIRFAENAFVVEQALHASYLNQWERTDGTVAQPACHHYVHFLKSTTALDPIEVGMAAVLPCFWIYKAVGEYIQNEQAAYLNKKSHSANPYQSWIDLYGGEEFNTAVQQAISFTNQAAEGTTAEIRKAMTQAFVTASNLEFDFWEGAYRLRKW